MNFETRLRDSPIASDYWFRLSTAHRSELRHEGDPRAGAVLILSRSADIEADRLARLLGAIGVPVERLNADDLPESADVDVGDLTKLGERPVIPTVSWTRRFSRTALGMPRSASDVLSADAWLELSREMARRASAVFPGTAPPVPRQLHDAAVRGIRIPRTALTTNPARSAARMTGDLFVVKTLGPHFVEFPRETVSIVFPEILDRTQLAARCPRRRHPVILQEYIPHESEVRTYYVDGELICFDVRKPDPAAVWRDPSHVTVVRVKPPQLLEDCIMSLIDAWYETFGLRFAAFDFLLCSGVPVFLECSVDGDWAWFDRKAGGLDVERCIARTISEHHRVAVHAGARSSQSETFDLVRFLTQD